MALPYIIADRAAFDALNPACQEHYTETNGKWVLDSPGSVPATRLDEFRQTNIDLKKQVEAFGDLTPEKAKELREKQAEIEASKATTPEKIKEEVEKRVATMKAEHETAANAMKTKLADTERQLAARIIDAGLIEAGAEFGLRASAHDDLVGRGRTIWKVEDGKPVAYDAGGVKMYGKTGELLTMKEWVEQATKAAPHLFEPSEGGGGGGSGNPNKGGGFSGPNPWKAESRNLTAQAKILKEDRPLAVRLAAQAGVRLAATAPTT